MKDEVFAEAMRSLMHPGGPAGRMRDLEREQGNQIIERDQPLAFGFSSADWDEDTLLTFSGRDVRIVLINALHPGTGAFRRLVDGIRAAGFTPVVISPVGTCMPAIMAKWGWKERLVGTGFTSCREWRAP